MKNPYFLLLIFLLFNGGNANVGTAYGGQGFTVNIKSDIPNEDITLHCQSKDTNLGYHVLNSAKLQYRWSFHENIWGSTLYFCHFWRKMDEQKFDVFNLKMSIWCDHGFGEGNTCNWEIKNDGFYFFDFRSQKWYKQYEWKPRENISRKIIKN
ncbi:unnamed protein product [Lactuca saligna]|uniref:S-protein homolog n=1 Tax=Lactuca saligna TaxID=75948 RepID=A0AA35ZEZ4_LACSI|nr:unnamed protein product [Lactuca saligna]